MESYVFPIFLSVALVFGLWLCERGLLPPVIARKAYLAGVGGGLIGARVWYALQYGDWSIAGGWASLGFVLGASLGSVLYLRVALKRCQFGEFADSVAPALAAGGALMRVACYLIGCNFGKVCDLPWGVEYGPGSPAFQKHVLDGLIPAQAESSLPIHPAQLYEMSFLLLLLAGLESIRRFRPTALLPGELFLGGVLLYSTGRFLLEFIRDDSGGVHLGPLTFAQASCVGLVLLSGGLILRGRRSHSQELLRLRTA